jgi:hypothetical protein
MTQPRHRSADFRCGYCEAPGCPAPAGAGSVGTSHALSASGSATVTARSGGPAARVCTRSAPTTGHAALRSDEQCSSSRMTCEGEHVGSTRSAISDTCSGVVTGCRAASRAGACAWNGRVAGPRFDCDRKSHLGDGRFQVRAMSTATPSAGRHKRVNAGAVVPICSSTRLGRNPASVLPPPVGEISSTLSPFIAWVNTAS